MAAPSSQRIAGSAARNGRPARPLNEIVWRLRKVDIRPLKDPPESETEPPESGVPYVDGVYGLIFFVAFVAVLWLTPESFGRPMRLFAAAICLAVGIERLVKFIRIARNKRG